EVCQSWPCDCVSTTRAVFGFHVKSITNPTPGQLQRRIRSQGSGYRCDVRPVISPRTLRALRTTLWITSGWIGAALLVHWIVRRGAAHLRRALSAGGGRAGGRARPPRGGGPTRSRGFAFPFRGCRFFYPPP